MFHKLLTGAYNLLNQPLGRYQQKLNSYDKDKNTKQDSTIEDKKAELSIDWLSMVLRLHQHNIGYTADGFYRSKDPTNSVKALKEGG